MSEDKRTLYIAVVNRSEDHPVDTKIRVKGWTPGASSPARVFEINGKDKNAANPFGSSENVNIQEKSWTFTGTEGSYRFPAHSVTVLELKGTI